MQAYSEQDDSAGCGGANESINRTARPRGSIMPSVGMANPCHFSAAGYA
jgi:hypothetical protein